MARRNRNEPMLAIALQTGRLGFVAMDRDGALLDYGITDFAIRRADKALRKAEKLLGRYSPKVTLLQDTEEDACCLGETARSIVSKIRVQFESANAKCEAISKRELFASEKSKRPSKLSFAQRLTASYPELGPYLPDAQKIWDNQPRSMCLFVALGMAIATTI